jgi:hypothetical protein
MTMIGLAGRPSDNADPRKTQKRVATTRSGRTVFIDITGDDRLRLLKQHLPGRWPEIMMARERGESLAWIASHYHVQPACNPCRFQRIPQRDTDGGVVATEEIHIGEPCLSFHMARIYSWFETALHDLADARARLLV